MVSFSSHSSLVFLMLLLLCSLSFNRSICCNEDDRRLLLIFKQDIEDPSNKLSNWSTEHDCCSWAGVICDNTTSRVTELDLQNLSSQPLRGKINLPSLLHLRFLYHLDLSYNEFEAIRMPSSSVNDSGLKFLDLSFNYGLNMDSLHWISKLSSLQSLALSGINLREETNWLQLFASFSSLYELDLKDCQLTYTHLNDDNVSFSSLTYLDLSENNLNYGFPNWMFNLSDEFYYLNLSYCGLIGQIPDFSGYRNLEWLILSNNKLTGSIPDWLGQIDLGYIDLSNNLLHGSIPSSLGNLSSSASLDISFNNLSGEFPKCFEQIFTFLGLSHNSISGDLSSVSLTSEYVFMASNKFKGSLPQISAKVRYLDLSHNFFSGPLSPLLCHYEHEKKDLKYLDVSDNLLFGELPNCWDNFTNLSYIYLGYNNLSGEVPDKMGSLLSLMSLGLHSNGFVGHIPSSFKNLKSLVLINIEGNNFSGSIPDWIPQSVSIVKLRSNQFNGNIPFQLCSLSNLTILDLADNGFSGLIPHCLSNLTSLASSLQNNGLISNDESEEVSRTIGYAFKITLYTKGRKFEYYKNLKLVRSIDFSANKLRGEIPSQLFNLVELHSLNLSFNYLTGKVPKQIGMMKEMESLDFSHNKLDGDIPQSISGLTFLSDLNLSFNNFTGQIPQGTQIQSFDAWSFIGNPGLCGAPLAKNCTEQEEPNMTKEGQENEADDDDDDSFLRSLYFGMGIGFAVSFWVISGSIFLNRACRRAFYRFADILVDQLNICCYGPNS